MEDKSSKNLIKIYCSKCGEYLGSYLKGSLVSCPNCHIFNSTEINNSESRKEDTR